MEKKVSIRFFGDKEVRAVWDYEHSRWMFSVIDVIEALTGSKNPRNYWKVMKHRLKENGSELVTNCNQLKLRSRDGKLYLTDCLPQDAMLQLVDAVPSRKAVPFIKWLTYNEDTIDAKSKEKAYALFDSSLIDTIEVGTTRGLQQIHSYLFGGLYDFAGKIRTRDISKGGFQFGLAAMLPFSLAQIEMMPNDTYEEIMDKYVEMNIAHPFMEGNGRSTRIWLDMMLKENLQMCVDWSQVNKYEYLAAMTKSPTDSTPIKDLLYVALTDQIDDRELLMKGLDYSYYYEQED